MPAYVIVDIQTTDQERTLRYRELSGPSVARHGGRFIVRGGATRVLEGDWDPERIVVTEFPSMEAARAWYDSSEYREARAVREGAGTYRMIAVEGVD
jgi:uncharacterized protein (DUF1330 family)